MNSFSFAVYLNDRSCLIVPLDTVDELIFPCNYTPLTLLFRSHLFFVKLKACLKLFCDSRLVFVISFKRMFLYVPKAIVDFETDL